MIYKTFYLIIFQVKISFCLVVYVYYILIRPFLIYERNTLFGLDLITEKVEEYEEYPL